jgi:hypothetical protein
MKKTVISIIAIVLVVTGAYLLFHSSSKTTTTNPTQTTPEVPKTPLVVESSLSTDKTYTTPDQYTVFKVAYPQFKNTSTAFNKNIADIVTAGIAQQKKDSADNWKARYDTQSPGENIPKLPAEADKFYFDTSWAPTQENNQYISFILTISAFEGGAHGYETLTSFNYDVVHKKDFTLASLFPNDPNYLKTISDFSRKDLEAQFRQRLNIKTSDDETNFQQTILPMLDDGTTPTADNFSVFTFTDKTITFYFNQYQVGPYSMGQSTVVMPRP